MYSTEKLRNYIYWTTLIFGHLLFVAVLVLVIAEAYVRWKINQDFTFLGGYELEALTLSAVALLISLKWYSKQR